MRHVRFTATLPPDVRPPLFDLIAGVEAAWIAETRLVNWNIASEYPAVLFVVTADRERFEAALEAVPEVKTADTTALTADQFALHLRLEPPSVLAQMFDAVVRNGLILVRPIVYRDGTVHGNVVGQPAEVQALFDALPSEIAPTIEGVSEFDVRREAPAAALSDRQLEAVRVAVELGYYESPHQATHADIAAEIGCSPSTVTEHLQKAERKLVTGALASYTD
ncbi:helix-turn-helix domain-containing protein [Halococcus saccharolyticus]|uniref:DNA binding protein n=1 Tax=Halococcus saccharolyticus DSM 5350 TaxID=1227455 RepID=M0MJV9_9EURY|nr:helix-turn-helix domain-containing protein [Halococcus saccharolyticus]EMA44740.1 DNA binding protein [Halococcus saccharolyticus DSM 5350]